MSQDKSAADYAPSAEEEKERIAEIGKQTNLGAGNQEPDPATAQTPPSDVRAGDKEREQT
jgi:hypothetical protein